MQNGLRMSRPVAMWLLCIVFATVMPARAQGPERQVSANAGADVQTGQIIDRIVCMADPSQSYAAYLPSNYSKVRAWPILYCFEPLARGRIPIEQYREAAERFGWIVVASWNSRNGPMRVSLDAGTAMWRDTHDRFRIDDRRVYASGFSGGARIATLVAVSCGGCIAGVIGCGAGFPETALKIESLKPEQLRFVYFATIGLEDYNFSELIELEPLLDKLGLTHDIARFDGAHQWAPSVLLVEAVGWMEVEAMRSGARAVDRKLVESLYSEGLARARAHESSGRAADAWRQFATLQRQFAGLRDTAEAAAGAKALAGNRLVREALKNDRDEVKQQNRLASEAATWAAARQDRDTRVEAIAEFRRCVAALRAKANASEDSSERRVSRRTINLLFANYYEGGLGAAQTGDHSKAIAMFELASEVAPQRPGPLLALAGERFASGDRKRALEALGSGLIVLAERAAAAGSASR